MTAADRCSQFLCPSLANMTGIAKYLASCPLDPPGLPTTQPPSSQPPSTNAPSTRPPSTSAPSTRPPSSGPVPDGACTANYRTVGSWSGGFQGEVTVTAGGSAINGWTVRWTLGGGQSITQLWNGTLSTSGSSVTVRNVSYNGSVQPAASTTFGFLGSGTPSTPSLTCTSP